MNSRTPISRNIARISGFSFLDFSHAVCSRTRPVTEIFREKERQRRRGWKRRRRSRASLTGFAIAPTFTKIDRIHYSRTVSRASRPCIIATRLFIQSASELSLLCFESRILWQNDWRRSLFNESFITGYWVWNFGEAKEICQVEEADWTEKRFPILFRDQVCRQSQNIARASRR